MAKKATIGAQITLDGEKQFKAALAEINAGLRVNASEMKMITAQYADNANGIEALTAKSDIMERQLLSQVEKVKELSAALHNSADKYGESSAKTMNWQTQLNSAKATLISMQSAYHENQRQLEEVTASMKEMGDSSVQSGKEVKKSGDVAESAFSGMLAKIDDLSGGAISAFKGVIDKVKETGTETDASSELMSAAMKGAPVAAAGTLVAAVIKIGKEAHEAALKIETSSARMEASLGLTKEAADKAAKSVRDIYKKGIADSEESAQEALTNVMRLMNLEGEAAEDAANKIIAMGADSREAARTASTMMNQFGISAEQALDIMAKGMTTSADKNGDLLDVLNEYSPSFQRMGYTADEFLTKIVAATDAGAYSADKAADVMKEFYNKAASGDDAFAEALQKLGFNADSTMAILTNGGDKAKQKFEDVARRLSNVSNETKQAQIASSLFGSQWEDVGTKATLALSNTQTELINSAGEAQRQFDVISNSAQTVETSINRSFEDVTNGIKGAISNAANPFGPLVGIKDSAINVYSAIKELSSSDGPQTGQAMIDGVKQGWASGEEEFYKQVEGTAKEANRRFNEAAEIHSPSRLFERESGAQMAAGVGVGWNKGMEKVQRDIERSARQMGRAYGETPAVPSPVLSSAAPSAVPSRAAAASSSGGDVYNVTIDAKNVKEFTDIVNLAKGARQARRAR